MTGIHDVAVTNITLYTMYNCPYVYQGSSVNISVTVSNNGDIAENVNVTVYYNMTANEEVGTENRTVLAGENETLLFVWNTTSVPLCYTNYTLMAVATIPLDSTPSDDTLFDGNIEVRIMGDINGDGKVDIKDINIAARAYGSTFGSPRLNLSADITGPNGVPDGKVDIRDIALMARNYGQHYP